MKVCLDVKSTNCCFQTSCTAPTSRTCRSRRWPTCWSRERRTRAGWWSTRRSSPPTTSCAMATRYQPINEWHVCLEVFLNFAFQRFTQYLASSNSNFQLNGFLDKTGVQGLLTKIKFEKACTFNMNHLDSIAPFNAKITSEVSHFY